jgi:hypothetical protein
MKKDLCVMIPSRSRVQYLDRTINELYSTCSSINNFDIFCFIDNDQIELYLPIIKKYPKIIWNFPPHVDKSFFNITNAQSKIAINSDYYFYWIFTDDFGGLNKNWDELILEKKGYYEDDLFILHTKSTIWGRHMEIFNSCYSLDKLKEIDPYKTPDSPGDYSQWTLFDVILHFNECSPIFTKKWLEMDSPIFQTGNYSSARELITACLIQQLYIKYDINRHVECNLEYNWGSCDLNTNRIINIDGTEKDDAVRSLIDERYCEDIIDVLVNMKNYINKHKK